jgi:hypothetical protein
MKAARVIAVVTLLFLGLSSCAGGVPLILDPTGGILKMSLSLLDHSPFRTFLIPGLILLLGNGALSLAIVVPVMRKARSSGMWVGLQGCVLFGWITVEVIMLRAVAWPHFVYWGVALVLLACGWVLRREPPSAARDVHASA